MKKARFALAAVAALLIIPGAVFGQDLFPQRSIEASISYDYLKPDSIYDDWKSSEFKYFHKVNPRNTLVAGIGESIRDESFAWVQAALYRDWHARFSTYTALTGATQTKWMGNLRFDNDFYFKFGKEYRFILATGQSVIYYDKDVLDYILSVGGIIYYPHLVIDGRHYFYMSDPGNVWSGSDRLSVGFGTRGNWWTTLTGTKGAQEYMGLSEQVSQDTWSASIMQEIWLNPRGGLKIGAGYLTIENGYDKYNASIGCFWALP